MSPSSMSGRQHRRHRLELVHVARVQPRDGQRQVGRVGRDPVDRAVGGVADGVRALGRRHRAGAPAARSARARAAAEEDVLQPGHDRLDLADDDRVEHRRHGLGVARDGGSAGDHDRVGLVAVGGQRRDARSPQHVADIEVVELERQAERDDREVGERSLRLDRERLARGFQPLTRCGTGRRRSSRRGPPSGCRPAPARRRPARTRSSRAALNRL